MNDQLKITNENKERMFFSPSIAFLVGLGLYAPALGIKISGVLVSLPFIFLLDYQFILTVVLRGLPKDRTVHKIMAAFVFLTVFLTISLFGLFQERVWLKIGGIFALGFYLTYAFSSPALIKGMKTGLILTVLIAGIQFFYFMLTGDYFLLPSLGFIEIATSTGNILAAWSDVGLPIRSAGLAGEPGFLSSILCISILFFRSRFMLTIIACGIIFSLSKITFVSLPLLALVLIATQVTWSRGLAVVSFLCFSVFLAFLSLAIYFHVRELDPQFTISWVDRTYSFYTFIYDYSWKHKLLGSGTYGFAQRMVPNVCTDFLRLGTYATLQECLLYPHTWLGSLLIETGLLGFSIVAFLIYLFGSNRESIRGIFFFLVCFMNVFYLTTYPIFSAVFAYILRGGKIGGHDLFSKKVSPGIGTD